MTDARFANYKFVKECRECGEKFGAQRAHAKFCADTCKKTFHNRRMKRGAEMYDFEMGKQYDRHLGGKGVNEKRCRQVIGALVQSFREADARSRNGRQSWMDYQEALDYLGRLPAVEDAR